MPSKKNATKEIHKKLSKRQGKRFSSFDRIYSFSSALSHHQYTIMRTLTDSNIQLASFLEKSTHCFRDASELSVFRRREMPLQLEHHFTLMKLVEKVRTVYEGRPIIDLSHRAMIAMETERVRFFDFDKGNEWSFNLNIGDLEPKRYRFRKVTGRECELFVPICGGEAGKEMTGMLVLGGADLSLAGSNNKTGKLAVQETGILSVGIMSMVSHIFAHRLDGLTGLPTRKDFERDLALAIEDYKQQGITFCLIMLDIDHFKKVNDTYGHLVGDRVLASFAKSVSNSVRDAIRGLDSSPDIVYRWGGEEFFIILKKINREDALEVAERMRRKIESTVIETEAGPLSITCSIGVVSIEDVEKPNRTAKSIEGLADNAMYSAKNNGRNRIYWVEQSKESMYSRKFKSKEK